MIILNIIYIKIFLAIKRNPPYHVELKSAVFAGAGWQSAGGGAKDALQLLSGLHAQNESPKF
jgi:hypothetical protein